MHADMAFRIQPLFEEILTEIKAPDAVWETLLSSGELNDLYRMALGYEKGEWEQTLELAKKLDIESDLISQSYIDALRWYSQLPL